jgi:Family of unknown function (DUF5362)
MNTLNENNLLEEGQISEDSKTQLSGIAQWANIVAIISFVSLAFSLVKLFIDFGKMSSELGRSIAMGSGIFGFVITAGITLLINITLFNAAKYVKLGVDQSDQGYFAMGIQKLGGYFKILGILFIIGLVIMTIALLFAMVIGATGANLMR